MTTLVRRTIGVVDPAEAARMSKSKLVPEHLANDAASAEYMMRIGAALGIDPTSAFQHIFVFPDGKGRLRAGMSAHLMQALAIAAGHEVYVEGDALKATAVLVRSTSLEKLRRFQMMRESERRQKQDTLEDLGTLYKMQRQQILDQIEDLQALASIGGDPVEGEVAALRKQIGELRSKYNFDELREQVSETKFDLAKLTRFESVWTMGRANKIGLNTKDVWKDYGPEMLKNRAKSTVVRDGAIDVILGVRSILSDLGVDFAAEDVDDRIAMSSALYPPEELGIEVDEDGKPLQGRVINVTAPGASKSQDRKITQAMQLVEGKTAEELRRWADTTARREGMSVDEKISRLNVTAKAVEMAGKADETVSQGDATCTLSTYLETTINTLR